MDKDAKQYLIDLGKRIAKAREENGFTEAGMARAIEVSEEIYRQIEMGEYEMLEIETVLRVTVATGISFINTDVIDEALEKARSLSFTKQRELGLL